MILLFQSRVPAAPHPHPPCSSRLDVLPGEAAGKFSLSMLGDAQAAMSSSLEASGVLADAAAAFEEADRLEALAEEALRAVDAIIWDSNMGHDVDETN